MVKANLSNLEPHKASAGFTLVELMIGIFIAALVSTAILSVYEAAGRIMQDQRYVADMQQNLRGSIYVMEQDIKAVGFDPDAAGLFGVLNIQRWTITDEKTNPEVDGNGSPSLTLASDWNQNGVLDSGLTPPERVTYRLFDEGDDDILDLVRDRDDPSDPTVGGRELVAEGIEAIAFAYAIDNGSGVLAATANNNLIWAVDTDNDGLLDAHLDSNDDGAIDAADDQNGDWIIDGLDGGVLNPPVPMSEIRMVRIWLLARAKQISKKYVNTDRTVIGGRIFPLDKDANGFNDAYKRRVLVRTVDCKNLGI